MASLSPPWHPIDSAPHVYGVTLLLWDPDYETWTIGYWDGSDWARWDGVLFDPTHWAPLPGRPAG